MNITYRRESDDQVSSGGGLPIAPSMDVVLESESMPRAGGAVSRRVAVLSAAAMLLGLLAVLIAQGLILLIDGITNLAFYGRWSVAAASPVEHDLGPLVVLLPIVGGLVVGLMARYGSQAIRGHGIPEAMEQVLLNRSCIPPKMIFLKPLSSAVSIGTGGPFGAEGPIIATGAAFGSFAGQLVRITADERKILLASGAAAGMAAIFGTPVSAVLLAVELLLFEFRARSMIPVALASATAAGARHAFVGTAPFLAMPTPDQPSGMALAVYIVLGAFAGLCSIGVTRLVYAIEDAFERLPVHWMWWPAIGGAVVGVVGFIDPSTLGVGYENIEALVSGELGLGVVAMLAILKLISWSISLGSGTSGGTLAPLFTIGGALGVLFGALAAQLLPQAEINLGIAALVGMAAMFAGASRALLASVVFAFEATRQPLGLLPLLGGCAAAYLISLLLMKNSIMTEKIARRGLRIGNEYAADPLLSTQVANWASREAVCVAASSTVAELRHWAQSAAPGSAHQGFPVLDDDGRLCGVITRSDFLERSLSPESRIRDVMKTPAVCISPGSSLREAADCMARQGVGRLVVVKPEAPWKPIGMLTHRDLINAHRAVLENAERAEAPLRFRLVRPRFGA